MEEQQAVAASQKSEKREPKLFPLPSRTNNNFTHLCILPGPAWTWIDLVT